MWEAIHAAVWNAPTAPDLSAAGGEGRLALR